ncbi:MAG: hypothetical protein OSA45_16065 [Halioglobus sp.]|nr:hypothetical protein [Halioglobus sp.]
MRQGYGNRSLVLKSRHVLIFMFTSYAVVFSLFIDAEARNYLVLFSGTVGGLCLIATGLKVQRHIIFALLLISSMAVQALVIGNDRGLLSVGLTAVYACGYFAIAALFARIQDQRAFLQNMAGWLITAFAILSVIQMVASLASLPVPNLILSKGLWSYNSLSMEPSHVGRVIGMTMLTYLVLMREPFRLENIIYIPKKQLKILAAFLTTMLLSGSALAAFAIVMVFALSRSLIWVIIVAVSVFLLWPLLELTNFVQTNRVMLLLPSFLSLDLDAIIATDSSGGSRFVPAVIYLQESMPSEIGFWMGYGRDELARFFLGRIPGFGDTVAAGFVPGFFVVYGVILATLFFGVFVLRFLSQTTAPLIVFWLIFISSSAWNTQIFWYGLILVQMTWAASSQDQALLKMKES